MENKFEENEVPKPLVVGTASEPRNPEQSFETEDLMEEPLFEDDDEESEFTDDEFEETSNDFDDENDDA
jgi:hypothetical protein